MSEQLWYTWSVNGLGRSNGLRVRAASEQLTEVEGYRVRNFLTLVGYALPEAIDQFLPPDQAPLNLTFLKTGNPPETVLVQKAYTGLDGLKRPGAFFSHLLTDLPEFPSSVPLGRLPFSAREAIQLWRSSLWRDSEVGWPASKYDLPPLPSSDLLSGVYNGSLTEQSVHQLAALFPLVFEAFLTLCLARERKRLYLVGEPDTVAALIWGITHSLPRTLTLMQQLTFSTFEANVETDAKPLIVGTCWQPAYLKKGYEQALLDLPAIYYQADNPYGIAIDCVNPQHHTPFTPTPLVSRYVRFAQSCFDLAVPAMPSLIFLQDAAEKREISELPAFLQHYIQFHEMLKEEDVTHVLTTLYERASTIQNQILQCLEKERLSEAIALFSSVGTLQMESEVVKRENVQQSLLALLLQKPNWWQQQGEQLLKKLFELSHNATKTQVTERGRRFTTMILQGKQWQKSQGIDLVNQLQAFSNSVGTDPRELLLVFTDMMELGFLDTQALLKDALLPLIRIFTDQLIQTLEHDQQEKYFFWNRALEPYLAGPVLWPEAWCYLLRTLSVHLRFNSTTQQWWSTSPIKQHLSQFRSQLVSSEQQPELRQALLTFATSLAQELASALRTENKAAMVFWNKLLLFVAPVKQEPQIWAVFLRHIGTVPYSSVYRTWYEADGRPFLMDFVYLARSHSPESSLRPSLSAYLQGVSNALQAAILKDQQEALTFWHMLLFQLAPPEIESALWLTLLFALRNNITEMGFFHWWQSQGQNTTSHLRRLAEQSKLDASNHLLPFVQEAEEQLARCIREEILENQHRYDGTIEFLLDIVTASVPAQNSRIWHDLVQKLSVGALVERCRWDLRALLLKSWKQISTLSSQEMFAQITPWLKVSWQDLDALLSLGLPEKWNKAAVHYSLDSYRTIPPEQVISIVTRHATLFEDVLQASMKSSSQPTTFFALLAQYGYSRTILLLDRLIQASAYQKETTEQLLRVARISTDQQIVTLLEQFCFVLLTSYELPHTMLQLIQRYLVNLDLEKLGTDATRNLFERLRNREQNPALRLPPEIQQTVESWYNIAAFLALPKATSRDLRILTRLSPEMQQKLSGTLIPRLAILITSEADLARTLDALRPDDPLPLLKELVEQVGERYVQEDRPSRLVPYVRMLLTETRNLAQEERELFVNDCFLLLFKNMPLDTRDRYFPEKLWPQELMDDWKQTSNFLDALNNLREALKEKHYIPAIADFYRPAFEKYYIDEQSLEIIMLAKRFMAEYQVSNVQGMLQVHESLKRFYAAPRYTPEQVNLMQAVRKRNSSSNSGLLPSMSRFPAAQGNNQVISPQSGILGTPRQTYPQASNASYHGAAKVDQSQYNKNLSAPPVRSAQIVAEIGKTMILLETYEDTYQVRKAYIQLRIEQNQRKVVDAENNKGLISKKEIELIKRNTSEMQKNINDIYKFRELVLRALIDDALIQAEIQLLSAREDYKVWLQGFWQRVERDTESAYAELQNATPNWHAPFSSMLSNPNDPLQIKRAIQVFIRCQLFEEECANDTSGIMDRIRDMRKTAKIDHQLAKYPRPHKKGW